MVTYANSLSVSGSGSSLTIPGHGSELHCCCYCHCCCRWPQHKEQAEHWAVPPGSWALERVECQGAGVQGDGYGGQSGACCCGCAESHRSAERMTPASSLNGRGSGTGEQGRGLHRGSAADSRMGVWAWLCPSFLLLYLTNLVCCHLNRAKHTII